jgi:hypothetical protein
MCKTIYQTEHEPIVSLSAKTREKLEVTIHILIHFAIQNIFCFFTFFIGRILYIGVREQFFEKRKFGTERGE